MRTSCLVIGAIGSLGVASCASWRQPVPTIADLRPTVDSASSQVVVIQPSSPAESPPQPSASIRTAGYVEKQQDAPIATHITDRLTLVADALDRGDKPAAARHLEAYIQEHPEEVMFRLQLIELLLQTNSDARAKAHLEEFVARAQSGPEAIRKYLVHAHTRLMEIAQREGDTFGEEFNRGVGLWLLVQEQDASPDRDEAFCEEMLCKALRALNAARDRDPGEPRVRVYLMEVYTRMGNRRAAAQERTAAQTPVFAGQLTGNEREKVILP